VKAKAQSPKRVNVVTLGCSKNIYDSEVLMGQLKANAIPTTHESEQPDFDTVIINTCGFIDNAKQESIDTILRYVDEKSAGTVQKVYVTGCLSERYGKELALEIPEVDAWFGTRDLPRLLKTLKADYKKELVGERLLTTPSHYAYFKISEGCDRPCSFCAIPLMRGKHVSTPIETLVARAEALAASGVKELIIIAQDSTYYGLDIYGKRRLADLLQALSQVKGIGWIRLHYAFPAGFPEDVLDVMAQTPNICPYLDIPLQHISDAMLKSMRRGTTKEKTYRLLQNFREKVPGISLRTTLITGYPGETEADFQDMLQFVKDIRFDRLGVFTYSHEENTHAYALEDNVPQEVKEDRAAAIMEVQQGISAALNEAKVGTIQRVLIDKLESGHYVGRTAADSPEVDNEVLIPQADGPCTIGEFCEVEITGSDDFDLYGVVVK
jgi:ribosomal protein S12 methylthiotransferase